MHLYDIDVWISFINDTRWKLEYSQVTGSTYRNTQSIVDFQCLPNNINKLNRK